ncbi:hypothetical protein F943_00147 [Acinetobacter ursingii NIPH 706]|uniref:Uncharacterized protein n=1 Tax=Acinetobacter ursingii TaxID=108980 RepID=A0A7T9Z798_9GAMM|nr:hypothetical protein F943_00147 [Acinetobacter ursingii NIPH 706]EXD35910.1 resistance factor to homoserine/threonine, RhtB family domain protein [Acinetobacter sp. 479375]MCU4523063.1 hypothetical protein [Acinetobacter ursingii]MCU4588825.1 hypothetical protein [Acinetobacter ursingii]QQT86738.1 hypothetical protein I6I53_02790 [Acinetobacter ursingii]
MYLSLLPQFIHPQHSNSLFQSIQLGLIQFFVSVSVNAITVFSAATIAFFTTKTYLGKVTTMVDGNSFSDAEL